MTKKVLLGIGLLILSPFLFLKAQIPTPVSFSISNQPESIAKNEVAIIQVDVEIEGEWHLYGLNIEPGGPIPTSFKISEGWEIAGEIEESTAKVVLDPNFNMEVPWHNSGAFFKVPIRYVGDEKGDQIADLSIRYMVCDDRSCLPPRTIKVNVFTSIDGEIESVNTSSNQESSIENESTSIIEDGISSFIWIAITAGFAALLTPCVFPMIPLTVSFFSKQNEGKKSGSISSALIFGVAIVGMFTVLGALLSLILGASGVNQFASNPWVNLFIGLVFVVFAISLLGLFELQLPYQLTNYLNQKSNESSGLAGILFMGLTISAVSFSCTAPFVGGVLAATTRGEWFFPIVGMIGFSTAFATPFVLFAMFPSWLNTLPKSGSWMNNVKVVLGFVELGAAIKFLSNADLVWSWGIISRPFAIAIWISITFLAAFYVLGKIRFAYETKLESITSVRLLVAIPILTFAFYLMPGLFGASLGVWDAWLPPKQATDVSIVTGLGRGSSEADEWANWNSSVDDAKSEAIQNNQLVFIDFTGYTCTNCRAMEANVFPLAEVEQRFDKYTLAKLYTDDGKDGPENQMYQFNLTGTVALPTYAIIDPSTGNLVAKKSGFIPKEEFIEFLDKALENNK